MKRLGACQKTKRLYDSLVKGSVDLLQNKF